MSIYAVHALCRDALRDPTVRASLADDSQAVLESRPLEPDERDALLRGDVAELYTRGAHEYVLMWLARAEVLGLTVPVFMERIRLAEPRYIY